MPQADLVALRSGDPADRVGLDGCGSLRPMPVPSVDRPGRRAASSDNQPVWVRLVRALAWTSAILGAAVTGSRWVDLAVSPLVLVQSLAPVAVVLSLAGLCGVLLPGRVGARAALVGMCLAPVVIQGVIWLPWVVEEDPGPGAELTVMTVNLFGGHADTRAVVRQVRVHHVDLLVLAEVSPASTAVLRRQGLENQLPYAVPVSGAGTAVLRSRLPLADAAGADRAAEVGSERFPTARLRLGHGVQVLGVHVAPPVPSRVREWRAHLAELNRRVRHTRGPTVVAGDFNASFDHPGMRRLLLAGLRDAHEVAGAGRPVTWPRGKRVPPFVHIDHVLLRGLDVRSAEQVQIPGSDHEAVLVRLVLPTRR
jgi:endonuclease/exonuclease/phosphatase (EEP) superfamily protein YafD